ncbi:hypothetical protein YC2023_036483 [Brassica napus]
MKRVKINVEKGTHADTILHHLHRLKVVADLTKAANHRNQPGNKTTISSKAKPPNTKTHTHEKENSRVHLQTIRYDNRRPTSKKTALPQSESQSSTIRKVQYRNGTRTCTLNRANDAGKRQYSEHTRGQTNLQDGT